MVPRRDMESPPTTKKGTCLLCGRSLHEENAYRSYYCSIECYEMDAMIREDERCYREERENNH